MLSRRYYKMILLTVLVLFIIRWQENLSALAFLSSVNIHPFKTAPNLPHYGTDLADLPLPQAALKVVQTTLIASGIAINHPEIVSNLPKLMGFHGQKTYLILFQNEYERRATGGFITAYAVVRVNKGKIHIEQSDNIYALDATIQDVNRPKLPRLIGSYLDKVDQLYIRDTNISPDFPTAVELFDKLYQHSRVKVDYDAIIAMDSQILLDLLDILGETTVNADTFSTKLDPRCNCPQALYTIWNKVGRRADYYKEDRKSVLGLLSKTLIKRITSPLSFPYWPEISNRIIKNLKQKHILVYFKDKRLQQAFAKANFTGSIAKNKSDYLHFNSMNFGGVKSNLYVEENITSITTIENSKIMRKVQIKFKNPQEHSDCAQERETLCLNAKLRSIVRLYVPKDSKLISSQGSFVPVRTYDELNKTVIEAVVEVLPLGLAQFNAVYQLPDFVKLDNYSLLIQPQPGTHKQKWNIIIDGKNKYTGRIDEDREILH